MFGDRQMRDLLCQPRIWIDQREHRKSSAICQAEVCRVCLWGGETRATLEADGNRRISSGKIDSIERRWLWMTSLSLMLLMPLKVPWERSRTKELLSRELTWRKELKVSAGRNFSAGRCYPIRINASSFASCLFLFLCSCNRNTIGVEFIYCDNHRYLS